MDDPNNPPQELPSNPEGEEIVPATQFSQEDENEEDGSPPQNLEEGAPTEHQETPNPNSSLFATPGKPPNQRDNLGDDMDEEDDEEMVAETPHFNRNQQGKLINYLLCYPNIIN